MQDCKFRTNPHVLHLYQHPVLNLLLRHRGVTHGHHFRYVPSLCMYRVYFLEQVQGHQCISTRTLPPLSKNFRNLPLVGHANRPHMRRGHGGAYLSYGKVRQTYRGAPCRISGSGDRRKGARGRIPRGHSCAFCVSSLYLTSPKTIEMTDWAPVWEMYMEFSIYRLDYISSVYTHARWTSKARSPALSLQLDRVRTALITGRTAGGSSSFFSSSSNLLI